MMKIPSGLLVRVEWLKIDGFPSDVGLINSVLTDMERFFHAGEKFALDDAIDFCNSTDTPPPKWMMEELARRSWAQVEDEKPKRKKGRHASPLEKQRQLLADADRFKVVSRLHKDGLNWVEAFEQAGVECHLSAEAVRKSYYRFKKGLETGTQYVSKLYVAHSASWGDVKNPAECRKGVHSWPGPAPGGSARGPFPRPPRT